MQELLDFVGVPQYGALLVTRGDSAYGYYTSGEALQQLCEDYPDSGLQWWIHPVEAPVAAALNRLTAGAAPETATRWYNVAVCLHDANEAATALYERLKHQALLWCTAADQHYALLALPPIDITADVAEAVLQRSIYASKLATTLGVATATACDWVPLYGDVTGIAPRTELPKLAAQLHRTIPPAVLRCINVQRGRIAKLWRGDATAALGHDSTGKPIDATPAAFDRAFVEAVQAKLGAEVSRDDLANALWHRPDSAARAEGIDAVYAVVDAVLDAAAATSVALAGPPRQSAQHYAPTVSLRDRLWNDYKVWSDRAGRYIWNIEVDLAIKARKVVDFLIDQGAELYHYQESNETVFVVDGQMVPIDVRNGEYQRWFTQHVQMFGPASSHGRELTAAVRVAVEASPRCHKPARARWGAFDRAASAMYLCFDPEHAEIVRIQPGSDGVPNVTVVANGTDGVTLRGPLGRLRKFVYQPGQIAPGWRCFRQLVHFGQALSPDDQLHSTAFNLAMLIPDHVQRPIKFHRGAMGSGKTYAAYDWELCLYGRKNSSSYIDRPSLLHAIKHAGPVVTQDNAEAGIRRKFADMYLVASTGASHKLRKFYTESQHLVYDPNASLILTAIEPMALPEEIRRTFEFEFDQKWHGPRSGVPSDREQQLEGLADSMLSAILDALSLYVLPDWRRRYDDCVAFIQRDCPRTSKSAFIDWLAWMLLIEESVGRYLSPDIDPRQAFVRYLAVMGRDELQARMVGSPALSCLEAIKFDGLLRITQDITSNWRSAPATCYAFGVRVLRNPDGTVVVGPLTTQQLYRAFTQAAKQVGLRLPYEDGRAFAARLTLLENDPAFPEQGWERQVLGRGHGNVSKFNYVYRPSTAETSNNPEGDAAAPTVEGHTG